MSLAGADVEKNINIVVGPPMLKMILDREIK